MVMILKLTQIKMYANRYNWSDIKEKHVYLIGSARFKDYFTISEMILQLEHYKLVSMCSFYSLVHKNEFSLEEWETLQKIALQKISSADAVLVIDGEYNGTVYIGGHTREELSTIDAIPVYHLSKLQL